MDKVIVVLFGGALIVAIYWFFFEKREELSEASEQIDVLVEGGYKPSTIKLHNGAETKIRITRKDKNSCLEEIVLPDFKIKKYLPIDETVEIKIKPDKIGEYSFHCGMNMYHGKIKVV